MSMIAISAISANLNVYASGLKITGIEDNKVTISYFLNAPADEVLFLLLNGANPDENNPVCSVDLGSNSAGAHTAVIDLSERVGAYTWAIKATCNTVNKEITKVVGGHGSDSRFNFYTPAGLAVDNNPNSPYFGRIYVTESREGVKTTSQRTVKQGVYIYGADLSDITNQGLNPYAGDVTWNTSNVDSDKDDNQDSMYGPARITIDDEGYVYVCDNGPLEDGTSGVWRMNPANPSASFDDVLHASENRGTLYQRINSATVVQENGKKYLYAVDNKCLDNSVANLLKVPIETTAAVQKTDKTTMTLTGMLNAHNTIVKGAYDDLWVFQFRNGVSATGLLHINKEGVIDLNQALQYNRRGSGAISPDGNWFAYCGYEYASIRIIPVTYDNNKKPSVGFGGANEMDITLPRNSKHENFVDGVAFDVAGNLYFASATSEWFYAYALPKANNTHTTLAPNNQNISLSAPRMMAYDLRMDLVESDFNFSFYANSTPTTGKLLFYRGNDRQVVVKEIELTSLKKGENNIVISAAEIPGYDQGKDIYWAVQLTGKPITQFGEVYQSDILMTRGHAAIDNSPESEYFGRIYIANRKGNNDGEVYLIDKDYSLVYSGVLRDKNGQEVKLGSAGRPAVDAEGFVYWADYGDGNSGIQVMNPLTYAVSQFFQGERDGFGVWRNSDVVVGSSTPGVFVYGSGSHTKLFMVNEDAASPLYAHSYCIYKIGQSDGSILREWETNPTKSVQVSDNSGQNFSIVGTSHGAFLCQNRAFGMNKDGMYSLQFYNNDGTCKYQSRDKADIINGSLGAGMAVSADERHLAMVDGNGDILLFDIEWREGDEPLLTFNKKYQTNFSAISTIHFDYAGNLVVMAGLGYASTGMTNDHRLVVYSQPTDNNTIIVPAPSSQRIPALILDEKKDNSTLLSAAQGKTTNTVRVLRSLTGGMYNTLCLPFALNSLEGTCLEGAKVYNYTRSEKQGEDLYLHFTETDRMEAGVPYLVEPTMDIDVLDFTDVKISVTAVEIEGTEDTNGVVFNGILAPKELKANNKSVLFLISGNRLAWADKTDDMYGFRGYFTVPSGASQIGARAFISTSESEMTALQQPTQQVEVTKFMHNGVLYIQRDGAIYTVMGTKVQ